MAKGSCENHRNFKKFSAFFKAIESTGFVLTTKRFASAIPVNALLRFVRQPSGKSI